MESITIFLAQLWGPAVLAVGLGIFINKSHYARIYRELEKEPFALLIFGIAGIVGAVVHIQAHNVWGSLPEFIISFFGWALLVKAAVLLVKPNIADHFADKVAASKMLPALSVAAIVVGAYLSWVGYFM